MANLAKAKSGADFTPARANEAFVSISALEGGMLTLFEKFFVQPSDPKIFELAPSMCFLISHPRSSIFEASSAPFRMLFDLGLRSGMDQYVPGIQAHMQARVEYGGTYQFQPGVLDSLEKAGLRPVDIDAISLSHVHWDHHGDTTIFPRAKIIVGPGAVDMLKNGVPNPASHMHFDPFSIPFERTLELPDIDAGSKTKYNAAAIDMPSHWRWQPLQSFPSAIDFFDDGSLYIINAPGHLTGHINLLCRVATNRWVYLGGDVYHDVRLLTGEKEIATWKDSEGQERCIHMDKEEAAMSIKRIRLLQKQLDDAGQSLEVIVAHDHAWYWDNRERFLPGVL